MRSSTRSLRLNRRTRYTRIAFVGARQRSLRMSLITSSDWRSSALISTRLVHRRSSRPRRLYYHKTPSFHNRDAATANGRVLLAFKTEKRFSPAMARRGITVMGARPCVNHALRPRAALQGGTFRSVDNAPAHRNRQISNDRLTSIGSDLVSRPRNLAVFSILAWPKSARTVCRSPVLLRMWRALVLRKESTP